LRAENQLHGPYEENIRDLEFALTLDAKMAHAHWLLAEIYLATGQADQALSAATEAVKLDSQNDAYLLRQARAWELLSRYDEAVTQTRQVLDHTDTPSLIQAQALHQMGRLAALGDAEIAEKAMRFHNDAIELADELAASKNVKQRQTARQLLVDAHLAIARNIATQNYDDKLEGISQWIGRASGLAEDYIENDGGSLLLRLQIAEAALAAVSELKPTKDPAPWIKESQESADSLIAEVDDLMWRRRIRWELGVAYLHAVRIEHTRHQTASALKYGQLAVENLAEGAKNRQAVPASERIVGRLYFHVGAVFAVHEQDHGQAVTWYDKAVPMLTSATPDSELFSPRREGETLVSMGVSYWKDGERSRALELTQLGASLVEEAVEAGVLDADTLAVPYGNLASMHRALGNTSEAEKFARLASSSGKARPAAIGPGQDGSRSTNVSHTVSQNRVRSASRESAVGRSVRSRGPASNNPGYSSRPRWN
jgi:tetratricopeptide (TPR) repeat protein